MTREEAIRHIRDLIAENNSIAPNMTVFEQEKEALYMAIEALQDRPTPCEKCIHVKSCRKVIILKNRTYKLIKYCSQGAERREP